MSIYVNRDPNAPCWKCPFCTYRIHHDHPGGWKDAVAAHQTAHRESSTPKRIHRTQEQRQAVEDALAKHRPMVAAIARSWEPIPGTDVNDVEQEGLIALLEAHEHFDPGRGVPFDRFADTVIRLRLHDFATKLQRKKQAPLNTAVVAVKGDDGQDVFLLELLADRAPTPHRVAEGRETLAELAYTIETVLTLVERTAIRGVMNGVEYRVMGESFVDGERGVDNAVQRARRKLREVAGMG